MKKSAGTSAAVVRAAPPSPLPEGLALLDPAGQQAFLDKFAELVQCPMW